MSFQMKLKDLVEFHPDGNVALKSEVANLINAKALPGKVQYHLSRIAKAAIQHIEAFIDSRVNLIKELGEEQENGSFQVKPENLAAFTERLSDMFDSDLAFDLKPLKISDLGDKFEGTTAADLAACHAFIHPEE